MQEPHRQIDSKEFLLRLKREIQIIAGLGRKVEYAVSDGYFENGRNRAGTDFQYLDTLIQAADALEEIIDHVTKVDSPPDNVDIIAAVSRTPLRDMAHRMTTIQTSLPHERPLNRSGEVDLF